MNAASLTYSVAWDQKMCLSGSANAENISPTVLSQEVYGEKQDFIKTTY